MIAKTQMMILGLMSALLIASPASACRYQLQPPLTLEEAKSEADAIFVGEVVAIANNRATFKVEKSWKGIQLQRVEVAFLGELKSSCDMSYDLKISDKRLVFARSADKPTEWTLPQFVPDRLVGWNLSIGTADPKEKSRAEEVIVQLGAPEMEYR